MAIDFVALKRQYSTALTEDVLPFWERHSIDPHGGYFSCLDRKGEVYDTDKFVWLQARQAYTFSMLYNRLEQRPRWLEIARHGIEFLRTHGMDGNGMWYFSLTRDGDPLVEPYNVFSDCFATMAFSQYAQASGDTRAREIAERTFRNILTRKANPKGTYSKIVPGTRPVRSYALPMILLNVLQEVAWMFPPQEFSEYRDSLIDEVVRFFIDPETGLVFEHVAPDGSHPDTFEGRLINPGHGIEGMWFLMDIARTRNDTVLVHRAVETILRILDFSWDKEYGGIFAFMDARGKPPLQLEWDQKLFWVHAETLVACLMGYAATGREECLTWFERVHEYTWQHYPDPVHGEWFGYLNRRGEVYLPLKGGKWKGCFHVPRTLFLCANILGELHG
jgi:N-acylglucosamine 2-epimerase